MRRSPLALLLCALVAAGCGGGDDDPVAQVPRDGGLREKVAAAQKVTAADFPAVDGRTISELATQFQARDGEAALATSVFTPGKSRLAFGSIDEQGQFVYGKTAVYLADSPTSVARGPYPAPADVLVTEPQFRSKQAATEKDPFAAVYAAEVPLRSAGGQVLITVTKVGSRMVAATGSIEVTAKRRDRIPDVGERAPKVETDTLADAGGNVANIDTRQPASDLHERSFADVVGDKPVALLFATPQLCQSRVCGPVVDEALQLRERYGDQVEFIHQEVYADNDPNKGLREPLVRFNVQTEPWLFIVGRDGRVTARLEGSFGLTAFEDAVKTAL